MRVWSLNVTTVGAASCFLIPVTNDGTGAGEQVCRGGRRRCVRGQPSQNQVVGDIGACGDVHVSSFLVLSRLIVPGPGVCSF